MVITQIIGGLGNQMFQYAVGRALSLENGCDLKVDMTAFETYKTWPFELDVFDTGLTAATPAEIRNYKGSKLNQALRTRGVPIFNGAYYKEKNLTYDSGLLKRKDPLYLEGYWQCEKYFQKYAETIRKDFKFKEEQDEKNSSLLEKIGRENAVAVHVRRGDYVSNSDANSFHGTCSLEYYDEAIRRMGESIENPSFYVFSDDSEWVKKFISANGHPVTYIDHNTGAKNYEDLRLMSACKHHIIANSSFSWWGAWLAEWEGQKVIAPDPWFQKSLTDIVPKRWSKL